MRANFTKKTKRESLTRSGGLCEAEGNFYGLMENRRCNAPLAHGVEFDHFDQDANSKDNSLANCRAVCPKCHDWKTRNVDTPKAAKTVRQQDRARGVVKPKGQITSRGFLRSEKPARDKLPLPSRRLVYVDK